MHRIRHPRNATGISSRVLGLALALLACAGPAFAQGADPANLVEKGRSLAIAADCAGCHTNPQGGEDFAGSYGIPTPVGPIYSSNITPSKTAGIGNYSVEDFTRAVRQGIRKDGSHLYPAMPYTAYTLISDEDIQALYAFFSQGVKPVDKPSQETKLTFPFNQRYLMMAWNLLFLSDKRYTPDKTKSAQWNRGAYLAKGPAHCGTCHTPRNLLLAERGDAFLAGASLGTWYAPNVTSNPNGGIGGWSVAELVQYMKASRVEGKAQAAGPMAEAVAASFQHMSDADLTAIATFLKDVPSKPDAGGLLKPRYDYGQPATTEATQGGAAAADPGWKVYSDNCAACHQPSGEGNQVFPSLFHNTATVSGRGDNLIATILNGVNFTVGDTEVFMPAFGDSAAAGQGLTNQQISDVSTFVFKHFGDPSWHFTADQVQVMRNGGSAPLLLRIAPAIVPGIVIMLLAVVALAWFLVRRRRRRRAGGTR